MFDVLVSGKNVNTLSCNLINDISIVVGGCSTLSNFELLKFSHQIHHPISLIVIQKRSRATWGPAYK